jgi:hypothetical protein
MQLPRYIRSMKSRLWTHTKWTFAAVASTAVLVTAPHSTADARQTSSPGAVQSPYCEPSEPIEDFGLSDLPATHEAPIDGELPFGPKTVSMSVEAGPILTAGGSVRFDVHSANYFGRTPLEWVMRDRLRPDRFCGEPRTGHLAWQTTHPLHPLCARRQTHPLPAKGPRVLSL